MTGHPSELVLEAYLFDRDASPVAPHLAQCDHCRARVARMYGRGTVATPLRDAPAWVYRGRGAIRVEYDLDGHVTAVETTSPEYASRSGIHVGIRLPPRLCHLVNYTCKHTWRGFTYETDYKTWERVSKLGPYARVLTTIRGRGYRFDPGPRVRYLAA